MQKIMPFIFLIPVILLAVWVHTLQTQRELGQPVIVAINGYDPRDLLSGHYIQYTIDWEKTDCTQFKNNVCPRHAFSARTRQGQTTAQRFYVPEKQAAELDRLLRSETGMKFEILYAYQKGKQPLAKQLLIDGQDWREKLK